MADGIKVREDALRIQQTDIQDTLTSIASESTKISFALAFESILVVESLNFVYGKPLLFKVAFTAAATIALATAITSLFAKKASIHTNVDELFVKKLTNDDWEDYLDNKHLRINEIYKELKILHMRKLTLTKTTFISLAVAVIILIIGVFI